MKKRLLYIDILRAFAIILVLLGHIPYPGFNESGLHRWIYAFHIPLFFFITGMVKSLVDYSHTNLKDRVKKSFYHIYLPFLIWAIIGSLSSISPISIPYILYGSHNSLMKVTNSSLWFLPTLFFSSILLDYILYFVNKKHLQSKLPLLLVGFFLLTLTLPPETNIINFIGCKGLPFGISIIPMALIFMLLGFFFETYKNRIIKPLPIIPKILVIVIALALTTYFAFKNSSINYVLMADNSYGNLLFFYPAALFGVIAFLLIALITTRFPKFLTKLFSLIGTNTLVIFTLHQYVLSLMIQLLNLLPITHLPTLVLILSSFFITLPVCLFVSLFTKKHLPSLTGIPPQSPIKRRRDHSV